jgi:lycopene beta-cyclase
MTYLSFLLMFLVAPLAGLGVWAALDRRRRRPWRGLHRGRADLALLAHVAIAVAYTTPWDNYLVASSVWWYDPARVLGVTLAWVPLEEYFFFVLQTAMTGLLWFALAARLPPAGRFTQWRAARVVAALALASVWLAAAAMLLVGWQPGTYLGLELVWALPPIGLQLAVGADILWHHRRSVLAAIILVSLYLCAADFLAIAAGVWTIDPAQSLNLFLGGVLPIEEAVFFLLTNTLVVFGLTLSLSPRTWERWASLKAALLRNPQVQEGA